MNAGEPEGSLVVRRGGSLVVSAPMLMSSDLAITASSVSQSRMGVPSFGAVSIGYQSTILSDSAMTRLP
jgi:hypothetical protein